MIKIAGFAFFLAVVSSDPAAALCSVPNIHLISGVTVTGYMSVTSGQGCLIRVNNSKGGSTSVDITKRPSNGTLEVRGLGVRYVSRAGFVGKDSFGYLRHSLDHRNNKPDLFPVTVEVTVAP
jgi:hypothetical protein